MIAGSPLPASILRLTSSDGPISVSFAVSFVVTFVVVLLVEPASPFFDALPEESAAFGRPLSAAVLAFSAIAAAATAAELAFDLAPLFSALESSANKPDEEVAP